MKGITLDVQNTQIVFRSLFAEPLFSMEEDEAELTEALYRANRDLGMLPGDIRYQSSAASIAEFNLSYYLLRTSATVRITPLALEISSFSDSEETPALLEQVADRATRAIKEVFPSFQEKYQEVFYEAHGQIVETRGQATGEGNASAVNEHLNSVFSQDLQVSEGLMGRAYGFYFKRERFASGIVFDVSAILQGYYVKTFVRTLGPESISDFRAWAVEEFQRLRAEFRVSLE